MLDSSPYHSSLYSFGAEYLTESGARLVASKPCWSLVSASLSVGVTGTVVLLSRQACMASRLMLWATSPAPLWGSGEQRLQLPGMHCPGDFGCFLTLAFPSREME